MIETRNLFSNPLTTPWPRLEPWAHSYERVGHFAQPLAEAHLYTQRDFGISAGEAINRCLGILGIGFLVLFLACLNYINLVVAQSPVRAREVGLRKVSGALRHHLIGQFLVESLLLATLAFSIALGLTYLSLPLVESMLNIELDVRSINLATFMTIPLAIVTVGVFS